MAISEGTEIKFNTMLIALLPKSFEANRLKDFRPLLKAFVTLSTSLSSKILATNNRLKPILPELA